MRKYKLATLKASNSFYQFNMTVMGLDDENISELINFNNMFRNLALVIRVDMDALNMEMEKTWLPSVSHILSRNLTSLESDSSNVLHRSTT